MKKFIALLLAMVMVFALCACSNNNDKKDDTNGDQASVKLKILDSEYVTEDYAIGIAKENTDLLEKVNAALKELKDDGTLKAVTDYFISGTGTLPEVQKNVAADAEELVMATNATFPPYETVEGDEIVGIDPTVAGLIADKLGMKLVIDDMEFDAIIPALTSGKADIAMAGMTVTEERLQSINFSDSYATGVQVIIVKEDSDITSADDIVAKIENGGFGEDHVQAFPKGADAIAALTSGKIDCVIIDNEPAKAFVEANNG